MSPISAFCFSTRSSPLFPFTSRLKNSFSPLSSVFHDMEYSGPSSSAESRRPAPTKLQDVVASPITVARSEEHTSELQSRPHLVCRLLLEKKKKNNMR